MTIFHQICAIRLLMRQGTMKSRFLPIATMLMMTILVACSAFADSENLDAMPPGAPPQDWMCGVTGEGSPKWQIAPDSSAPSGPNVLKQTGSGTFPWCVMKSVSITDGFVEVKFKPLSGRADQAGGLVWRWKDANDYYVARANALENNVSLYYTKKGRRISIRYV